MSVPIILLEIPTSVKNSLLQHDIFTLKDLEKVQLTLILDSSLHSHIEKVSQECKKWQQITLSFSVSSPLPFDPRKLNSLSQILQAEDLARSKIKLFPTAFPISGKKFAFLNGIFALGSVVEICGDVASGKTQIATQLGLCCQLKESLGGVNGEALYVDTEGGFDPSRALEMSIELKQRLSSYNKQEGIEDRMKVETMLGGIKYVRVMDHKEQGCLLQYLEEVLSTLKNIKLIVFDSFPAMYRSGPEPYYDKVKPADKAIQKLLQLASKYKVVLINVLTVGIKLTKFDQHPLFNERMYHLVTSRIYLTKDHSGIIKAERIKAPLSALYDGTNYMKVTKGGLELIS